MVSFDDIIDKPIPQGIRLMVYGPPKVGKSFFASHIPNHLFFNFENGLNHLEHASKTPLLDTYEKFLDWLNFVAANFNDDKRPIRTVVIDTVDKMEDVIRKSIVKDMNNPTIKDLVDIPYGKGYEYLLSRTKDLLKKFEWFVSQNINIVFISHDEIKQKILPSGETYNYHAPSLFSRTGKGDSTLKIYNDYMDVIAMCDFRRIVTEKKEGFTKITSAKGNGDRIMFMESGNPAYIGGSRYDLPGQIPFDWDSFKKALKQSKKVREVAAETPDENEEEPQE